MHAMAMATLSYAMDMTPMRRTIPGPRRRFQALAGAVGGFATLALLFGAQSPGGAIRSDLAAGAAAVGALAHGATAADAREALQPSLAGRWSSIDASRFPAAVAVTIRSLDRQACVEAESSARRLEGDVVVELVGYRAAADCREANDMTWRIMP
jgi:hypothetical protein